uniref:Secreted protein n=2 Tax=Triticum urartu TaxID=4572 RepID=A0A8R7TUD8_TRIUA
MGCSLQYYHLVLFFFHFRCEATAQVRPCEALPLHASTLDPMSTRLLIVCVGNATKVFDRYRVGVSSLEKQHQLGIQIHQHMYMHLIGGELLHGYP